jgi:16S rRNA (uracil1498-N3)-methyltransferase
MELPYFFQPEGGIGQKVLLDETNTRHALQVLRMQPGNSMQLTNGLGTLWTGVIEEAAKKKCVVNITGEVFHPRVQVRKSAMAISPVKNASRFEWFLEKATELGIAEIFPLICHRTERTHMRADRLQQICISAMLQSRQVWLPVLHDAMPLAVFLKEKGVAYHHRWVAHCESYEKHLLAKALQPGMHDSLLLIGPEGDFTPDEIFEATNGGYIGVSLGNTRLRTETAGVVGAALMCLL